MPNPNPNADSNPNPKFNPNPNPNLGPNDWFGETSLLRQCKRTATVEAKEDTLLLRLDQPYDSPVRPSVSRSVTRRDVALCHGISENLGLPGTTQYYRILPGTTGKLLSG
eukprot:1392346-Amorphochlora_amoeboformis.AAC.1